MRGKDEHGHETNFLIADAGACFAGEGCVQSSRNPSGHGVRIPVQHGDDRKPELAEPTQDAGEAPFHGFEKWQRAAPPLREHREEWPEEKSEHRRGPQSILEGWQERRFLRASLFRFLRFQIGAPPPCFL